MYSFQCCSFYEHSIYLYYKVYIIIIQNNTHLVKSMPGDNNTNLGTKLSVFQKAIWERLFK